MQLFKTLALLAAASVGATDAYVVRIGYKISFLPAEIPTEYCRPFFKVWDDNLSYVGEKEFPNLQRTCNAPRKDPFCKTYGCPFQVDNITIGIRVVQDGGADKAIRVEAWKGAKSTWAWCSRIYKTEARGYTEFYWECNFPGL